MSSFEDRYVISNPSLWQRIYRDIALFTDSLMFLFMWLRKGREIRLALRQAEKENKKIVLEEHLGE
jgi:hypothetical protein